MNVPPPFKVAHASSVILPEEVIVEVLSFLEVKSLMRMKCVCKSWNAIISDPIFAKMHLKKSISSTRNIHLALLSNMSQGSGDCRTVPISCLLEKSSNFITDADIPYHYQFHYKDGSGIVASCNGLVCLQSCSDTSSYLEYSLSFWNPATRTVSDTSVTFRSYVKQPQYETCKFSFGYDNSTDTYKVVLLTLKTNGDLVALGRTAARIFTLGRNNDAANCWRKIQSFPVVVVPGRFLFTQGLSIYLNNSICWLVCHWKNLCIEFIIVSLDLRTETYTQFLLPPSCNEELIGRPILSVPDNCLSVLMNHVCISHDFSRTHFMMWKMEEFGVEKSWTQFLKISYMNLQIDYFPQLIPLCLSENGETIIFSINLADQVILYNWRNNRVKRIKSTNKIFWRNAKAYVEGLISTDF